MNIFKRFFNWLFGRKATDSPLAQIAEPADVVHTAHGTARRLHRRAVREFLNGNYKPLMILSKKTKIFNCGDTLRRKLKRKIESQYRHGGKHA